tara:strand:+ start:1315 stop:1419 length:105 start_codon:yes stop_codon:yes gene_type:complete
MIAFGLYGKLKFQQVIENLWFSWRQIVVAIEQRD